MDIRIDLKPLDCLLLALMCMVVPLEWLLASVAAAAVHEAFHLLAVNLCGGTVYSVRIGGSGAVMDSALTEGWKELLCILAGPAGSFAVMLVSAWFPRTAVCALVQGVYNLLPVYPLDGGRAVRCVTSMLFRETTGRTIDSALEWMTVILVCVSGVAGTCVLDLGYLPLLMAGIFSLKHLPGKIPCKDGRFRVQYRYHI